MADHTLVNLKQDVKDMAAEFGMPPGMEARFARGELQMGAIGMMYLELTPNTRIPFGHRHGEGEEEVYVVVGGTARLKVDDEVLELGQWDAVRVPGEAMRNLEGGADGAVVLAFGHKTEGPETEMVPDWWKD